MLLCYHKCGPQVEEGTFLNVEPADLGRHVRFLMRRGYQTRPVRELQGGLRPGNLALTFDDAYRSTVQHAVPLLHALGATATLYAVAAKIGGTSDWDGERARPLASLDELLNAQALGFEIGNHTRSHLRLADLDAETVHNEIVGGREALREMGLGAESVCYPYGHATPDAVKAAERAGHQVGVALGKRWAVDADSLLALPRIVVAYSDRMAGLLYRLYVRPWLP